MTTPTHLLTSLALLARKDRPEANKWLLLGGFLPDAVIYWFFFWEGLVRGGSNEYLWDELYFTPFWQAAVDYWNSIPLILLALGLAFYRKILWLQALTLSMLVHVLGDLPVHNDDAHAHFLPLSNWKFISPISYWDPSHYGDYFLWVELIIIGVCLYCAYPRLNSKAARRWLLGLGGFWFLVCLAGGIFQIIY